MPALEKLRSSLRSVFGRGGNLPNYVERLDVVPAERRDVTTPVAAMVAEFNGKVPYYPPFSSGASITLGYRHNAVFRRSVDLLCNEAAQGILRVVNDKTRVEFPNHGLTEAFYRGSIRSTGPRLIRATVRDLYTGGNALWEKARNGFGEVVEYWRLDPRRIAIETHPTKIVGRYLYSCAGQWYPIETKDVLHWRFDDPLQPYFGIPPILSASRDLAVDNELVDYFKVTLQNLGVPPIVVHTEEQLDEEDADKARRVWGKKFGGQNRGKPAFMGGTKSVQVIGLDLQKMAIGDLISTSESRIAMVHGVPMILLGRSGTQADPTRANYAEAKEHFVVSAVLPLLSQIAEELSAFGLPDFPGSEQLDVDFDTSQIPILQEAKLRRATSSSRLFSEGLISRRAAQKLAGLDEQGPDVFYRSSGVDSVFPADATAEQIDPPDEL